MNFQIQLCGRVRKDSGFMMKLRERIKFVYSSIFHLKTPKKEVLDRTGRHEASG